ncbi:MAG: threonine/serine exporter family protein [Clostridia bacterium]|nr:threonine/serine exporter family protein [Clostridia bacterium]
MNKNEYNRLVDLLLDFGEAMLLSGGEVSRVEDSIARMGRAFGALETDVFVITSSIVLTLCFEDSVRITSTRRIVSSVSTDFIKLEKLNDLSRKCADKNPNIDELGNKLGEIKKLHVRNNKFYIGSLLAAGGFAIFFGGSVPDGVAAGVFALAICLLQQRVAPKCPNSIIFNFICSAVIGGCICLIAGLLPFLHSDKIIIGDIMLLIPGIAITNSVRDMLVGNMLSGGIKFIESLLCTGALSLGFMLAISAIGV